jgi:hypothetical protein
MGPQNEQIHYVAPGFRGARVWKKDCSEFTKQPIQTTQNGLKRWTTYDKVGSLSDFLMTKNGTLRFCCGWAWGFSTSLLKTGGDFPSLMPRILRSERPLRTGELD